MAKTTDCILPKMGESITEGTILNWLIDEGAAFSEGDILVEVGTDKVDNEVPAPFDGILLKQLVSAGDVVKIGAPVAQLQPEENTAKQTVKADNIDANPKQLGGLEEIDEKTKKGV